MLNKLWIAAIVLRIIAGTIGTIRRAPPPWLIWITFGAATDGVLLWLDLIHSGGPHGWYVRVWIAQQIGSAVLLAWVVRVAIKPPETLALAAVIVTCAFGVFLCTVRNFPDSPIEPVLIVCGLLVLAMGIMASAGMVRLFRPDRCILAMYLILSAFLMLAAPDYLKHAGLGQAWEILEIVAFTAWGGYYVIAPPAVTSGNSF